MVHAGLRFIVLACAALCANVAWAEYGEECRGLSAQLARDPGSLKVGDLDVLKTCLSDLQRVLIVGGKPPEGVADLCPSPVVEVPKCPSPATAPKRAAEPAAREAPKEPAPDRRLKPSLPVF